MDFWNNFNNLKIILDDEVVDKNYIEYELNKEIYITAITSIFRSTIDYYKNRNDKRMHKSRQSNIYAFIGKRGSGKTTAMNEFCYIIGDLNDRNKRQWWIERMPEEVRYSITDKKFNFRVFKPIDASLLEKKEDLFELILVKLYEIYQEYLKSNTIDIHENGVCSKNINLQFEKVLQMYRAIKRGEEEETSSIASLLKFMGSSIEIADGLAQLVESILLLDLPKDDCAYSYIVIAIDDLDLNIGYGYEMLEQLQKYFCYYKIIIVVAVDYEQMVLVCTQHFINELKSAERIESEYITHSCKLANNFMTKMFPFSQRAFMLDIKKNTKRVKISVGDGKAVFIKQYILGKIAKAMYIYYDAIGEKCHFSEPDTVRELVFYNNLLEDLVRINYDEFALNNECKSDMDCARKKEFMMYYDRNHQRFNSDITVRQCQTTLDADQQREFKRLLEHVLKRRAGYTIKLALKRMQCHVQSIDQIQSEYTYGRLLEIIYKWGREIPEDKPLISCIIASFTSEMVREYINYRHAINSVQKEESRQQLVGFLGNSFGNEWTGKCLEISRRINQRSIPNFHKMGFSRDAEPKSFIIGFEKPTFRNITNEQVLKSDLENWLDKEKIVSIVECIDMFVISKDGNQYGGLEICFKDMIRSADEEIFKKNQESEISSKIFACCNKENFSIDIMAFVAKSLDYNAQRKRVLDMLTKALADEIFKCINVVEKEIKTGCLSKEKVYNVIKVIVEERGLLKKEEVEVALPFYNLDLVYNIFKRVHTKNVVIRKKYENIYSDLKNIYKDIEQELKKEEDYYRDINVPFGYTKIFQENPYIKMFNEISNDIQNIVFKVLCDMAESPSRKPDDTSDNY